MEVVVSVVITTYKRNVEDIVPSIDSVRYQTYKNIELIVVDDSPESFEGRNNVSTFFSDLTDERVKYIQHEKNMGACVARNTGLANSCGEYIAFLDDDDIWLPNKVEMQLKKFVDEKVGLVYCDAVIIDANGSIRKWFGRNKPIRGKVYDQLMCSNFIGSTSFPMMRRSVIEDVGGFDPEMEASQDWDTWIRITKHCEVDYVNEALVKYIIHPGERISNSAEKRIRALKRLNSKNEQYLSNHPIAAYKRKSYEMRLNVLAENSKEALASYFEAIKMRPFSIIDNIMLAKAFGRIFFPDKGSSTVPVKQK